MSPLRPDRPNERDQVRADPVRIVSAGTSGVTFPAAGVIVQTRGRVLGPTTGGSLWMAGAIGLACGLGEYALAAGVAATLIVPSVAKAPQTLVFDRQAKADVSSPKRRERG